MYIIVHIYIYMYILHHHLSDRWFTIDVLMTIESYRYYVVKVVVYQFHRYYLLH